MYLGKKESGVGTGRSGRKENCSKDVIYERRIKGGKRKYFPSLPHLPSWFTHFTLQHIVLSDSCMINVEKEILLCFSVSCNLLASVSLISGTKGVYQHSSSARIIQLLSPLVSDI